MTERSDVRLAVVGSTAFDRDPAAMVVAMQLVLVTVKRHCPAVVVSGGAVGVDQAAALVARSCGIDVVEHLPKRRRWKPDGYAARNVLIVEDCTHLLCIRHEDSQTYGSGWTADRAQQAGKVVWRYTIGRDGHGQILARATPQTSR